MKPKSIKEINEYFVGRILDHIGVESDIKRWGDK